MFCAARSTACAIGATRSGIGPVKAIGLPMLTSATAVVANIPSSVFANSIFFMFSLPVPASYLFDRGEAGLTSGSIPAGYFCNTTCIRIPISIIRKNPARVASNPVSKVWNT